MFSTIEVNTEATRDFSQQATSSVEADMLLLVSCNLSTWIYDQISKPEWFSC